MSVFDLLESGGAGLVLAGKGGAPKGGGVVVRGGAEPGVADGAATALPSLSKSSGDKPIGEGSLPSGEGITLGALMGTGSIDLSTPLPRLAESKEGKLGGGGADISDFVSGKEESGGPESKPGGGAGIKGGSSKESA